MNFLSCKWYCKCLIFHNRIAFFKINFPPIKIHASLITPIGSLFFIAWVNKSSYFLSFFSLFDAISFFEKKTHDIKEEMEHGNIIRVIVYASYMQVQYNMTRNKTCDQFVVDYFHKWRYMHHCLPFHQHVYVCLLDFVKSRNFNKVRSWPCFFLLLVQL